MVLVLASSSWTVTACGDADDDEPVADAARAAEPYLYFYSGPSSVRNSEDRVVVTGELWSDVEWPMGDEFCVTATWLDPAPAGSAQPMDQLCSTDAVPKLQRPGEPWPFTLRSSDSVERSAADADPWALAVTITSDYHANRDNDVTVTLAVD